VQVRALRVGERVDLHAERRELELRDVAVNSIRHRVHAR
jgi:hypothetical protein